ncbi:pyruvoyl-dependent arginine decarboxylase [Nocardia alni]|uniref:pyruvoyl-dependent arginine decarboxylase n=1 Tax=Nocardia alni TaxID=2815723 RepID=UPI001C246DC1|nr:pyruvoyl-dependent arginine decarboxylase [Nocardia alni]
MLTTYRQHGPHSGSHPIAGTGQTRSTALTIEVGAAIGRGATSIAAFDAALRELGVADANLIRLSSVIPPQTTIERTRRVRMPIAWGDRLYCVYASHIATERGSDVAAGLGWALREDGSGAGLFVEHEGESGWEVDELIHASLADMTARRAESFGPVRTCTVAARSDGRPTCALVLAAYLTVGWTVP